MDTYLKGRVNVDYPDEKDKRTALQWAARLGHLEIVKKLIAKKADVYLLDGTKKDALDWASIEGREEVVKELLSSQKIRTVTTEVKHGHWTALHWAAEKGHKDIVHLLVDGKDVDAKDESGRTACIIAATAGHKDIVEILRNKKANLETKDSKFQRTALHWAAYYGNIESLMILLAKNSTSEPLLYLNQKDIYGCRALHYAAENGYLETTKFLLDMDVQHMDMGDSYGQTPLWRAAWKGREEIVKFLLQNVTSEQIIDLKDKKSQTVLHAACQNGHGRTLKLLLDKARNASDKTRFINFVNTKDGIGSSTALHCAVGGMGRQEQQGRTTEEDAKTAVWVLLNAKASTDLIDNNLRSPIKLAAWRGNSHAVRLLLEESAKTQTQQTQANDSVKEKDVLYWAATGYVQAVRRQLQVYVPEEDRLTTLVSSPDRGHQKVFYQLQEHGLDGSLLQILKSMSTIEIKDAIGQIFIRGAITKGGKSNWRKTIDGIIDTGVNIHLKDWPKKQTLLHLAAVSNKPEIYDYLAGKNAQQWKDSNGKIPSVLKALKGEAENGAGDKSLLTRQDCMLFGALVAKFTQPIYITY